ncbi:hypothetical protein GO613_14710 [Azoarcus communis]|uniref:hypothetical protein n=1 Tax=Parazoarcus communis TaxID=41977 RepID=UPI0014591C4E|nr:hypothetical protein [Parazoarcus communis]NMG49346.1 hypothetical protein [Parazoarcus communis]
MDLLHFDPEPLYFDDPLPEGVMELVERAGEFYGAPEAEAALAEAGQRAPDHLLVLVARYRYHFYRHQMDEAASVVWHAIAVSGKRVGLPASGMGRDATAVAAAGKLSMTLTRFYLSALKAAAYIRLRTGDVGGAIALLEPLVSIDEADRLGSKVLLDVARATEESTCTTTP